MGLDAAGGVTVARGVEKQRIDSDGGVIAAGAIAKECVETESGVVAARGVADKRTCSQAGVGALRRSNPHKGERKNQASNNDRQKRSTVGRIAQHIKPSSISKLASGFSILAMKNIAALVNSS
jgi:hypothetical protein